MSIKTRDSNPLSRPSKLIIFSTIKILREDLYAIYQRGMYGRKGDGDLQVSLFKVWQKGEGRSPRAKPSSEAMKRANIRKQTKRLRREMNANFVDGKDALITLDFDQAHYPGDSKEMIQMAQKLVS